MSSGSLFAQIFVSVDRHRDHDDRRLLHLLVETAGQAVAKGAGAEGRLNQARPGLF